LSIHLGHEKSADFGNNVFLANGLEVNHQYDKSSAYVQLAKQHVQRHVMAELDIATPLAHLYEIDVRTVTVIVIVIARSGQARPPPPPSLCACT
jgi:hypothetical protein